MQGLLLSCLIPSAILAMGAVSRLLHGAIAPPADFVSFQSLRSDFPDQQRALLQNMTITAPSTGGTIAVALPEAQHLFHRWNVALASMDTNKVARQYTQEAILVPIESNIPLEGNEAIKKYFETFLIQKPQVVQLESHVTYSDFEFKDEGTMLLSMGSNESQINVKYTLVYKRDQEGDWKISRHYMSTEAHDLKRSVELPPNALHKSNASLTEKPWKYFPWELPHNNHTIPNNQQDQWAVMVISMGQTAAKFRIVERIWLSVRRRGDFFGPFIVLTDASPDRYLGIQESDPNFYQIQPSATDYNWDPAFVDEAMPYKRFKTHLTDYLDRSDDDRLTHVKYVQYLDADVVVGKSLKPWFDVCEQKLAGPTVGSNPAMLFFQGNFDDMPIQSGQFALHRERSMSCLQQWRQIIDTHPHWNKDQYSLKVLNEEVDKYGCSMEILLQEPWLEFVKRYTLENVIAKKNFSTLMHIQNTGHANLMRKDLVQKLFRELLFLTPQEAELNWKTPIRPSRDWSMEQVGS